MKTGNLIETYYKIFLLILLCMPSLASQASGRVNYFGCLKPGGFVVARSSGIKRAFFGGKEIKTDGEFVAFGFDRDDRGRYLLELVFSSGEKKSKSFELPERKYFVQHVKGLQKEHATPGPGHFKRIQREREVLENAYQAAALEEKAYFSSGFTRPVEGGRITSVFGSKRIINGEERAPHNGIDIALAEGTSVKAMADGVVLLADDFFFAGKYVMISHGQGLVGFYMHLCQIDVEPGENVGKGQKIGEVGMSGRATGPHLHWGLQWMGRRIDPSSVIDIGLEKETEHFIEVDVSKQKLYLYRDRELVKTYFVSTSQNGVGNKSGSYKTPSGLHRIAGKFGDGARLGTVFKGRVDTGQVTEIYYDQRKSARDYILTRVLRLEGLEPGINKGEGIDSFDRYIYIHGTKEEGLIREPVSKGCIRMRNTEVIELFDIVENGTFVEIIP